MRFTKQRKIQLNERTYNKRFWKKFKRDCFERWKTDDMVTREMWERSQKNIYGLNLIGGDR